MSRVRPWRRDHPTASSSVETTRPLLTSATPHNSISPLGGSRIQSSSPSRLFARSRSQSALKSGAQERKLWRRRTAANDVRFFRYDRGSFILTPNESHHWRRASVVKYEQERNPAVQCMCLFGAPIQFCVQYPNHVRWQAQANPGGRRIHLCQRHAPRRLTP